MRASWLVGTILVLGTGLHGCGRVDGSVAFVLGGTSAASGPLRLPDTLPARVMATAGAEFIVSPRKARITFTEINYQGANNRGLGSSKFTNCTVTYDRSLASGSTLLDCPYTAPVGEIHSLGLYFDKALEVLVDDPSVGIFSDPASPTGFSTSRPAAGPAFVPFTIQIGSGTTRSTSITLAQPFTVDSASNAQLFVTMDMIHTIQLKVDANGQTATPHIFSDPVALFAGPTAGSSAYYSGAATTEGYGVEGVPSLRIFNDAAGNPLYAMMGPNFCGNPGPKGAHASAPTPNGSGGWLGKDANKVIAFALPIDGSFSSYASYYVMQEASSVGQTTTLKCKISASPPPPLDGKTYASGAPLMDSPDTVSVMRLLAK